MLREIGKYIKHYNGWYHERIAVMALFEYDIQSNTFINGDKWYNGTCNLILWELNISIGYCTEDENSVSK